MIDDFSLSAQLSMSRTVTIGLVIASNRLQLLAQLPVMVLLFGRRPIAVAGAADTAERATAARGESPLAHGRDQLTLTLRAQQFFASTSLMTSISKQHSAKRRFK